MNKHLTRILTLVLAVVLCLSLAIPAMADGTKPPVNSTGHVKIDKDLVMPQYAVVPEETFNFELSKYNGSAGKTVSGWRIFEGITDGVKIDSKGTTSASVTFTSSDPTTAGSDNDNVTKVATEKYATKTMDLDFSAVKWPEPGVYRYTFKETKGSKADITYDETTFYIDIYVVDNGNGPEIGNTVVTKKDTITPDPDPDATPDSGSGEGGSATPTPGIDESEKVDANVPTPEVTPTPNPDDVLPGETQPSDPDVTPTPDPNTTTPNPGTNLGESNADFINRYTPVILKLEKKVTGNQGNKDEEFEFEVKLGPTVENGVYTITNNSGIVGRLVVREGVGVATVKLTDSDSIQLYVRTGDAYMITEHGAEDYETTSTGAATNAAKGGAKVASGAAAATNEVVFTNHKQGDIPTGVLLTIAPFVVLMAVGLFGLIAVAKKRRED